MKFTKEEAFDELKKQLKKIVGDPAINDRTIKEQTETLIALIGNDDIELADFVTKSLPILKSSDGDNRKYASDFVKKWNKEHPAPNNEGEGNKGGEPNKEYEELMKRIEKLEKEKAENDRKSLIAGKRSNLAKALKEKGVNDESWIEDLLGEVTIGEETDIDASADKYLKLYNRSHAQTPPSVTPVGGGQPRQDDNPFADVSKLRQNMEAQLKGTITQN